MLVSRWPQQGRSQTPAAARDQLSLAHRKRENSPQEDRGSFVTTPTAELSSQEETLLGSFLDWSLDYCSGYEGDQESEGEKEGDGEPGRDDELILEHSVRCVHAQTPDSVGS